MKYGPGKSSGRGISKAGRGNARCIGNHCRGMGCKGSLRPEARPINEILNERSERGRAGSGAGRRARVLGRGSVAPDTCGMPGKGLQLAHAIQLIAGEGRQGRGGIPKSSSGHSQHAACRSASAWGAGDAACCGAAGGVPCARGRRMAAKASAARCSLSCAAAFQSCCHAAGPPAQPPTWCWCCHSEASPAQRSAAAAADGRGLGAGGTCRCTAGLSQGAAPHRPAGTADSVGGIAGAAAPAARHGTVPAAQASASASSSGMGDSRLGGCRISTRASISLVSK